MLVKVYGGKPAVKALIHDAVNFAARKLMSSRLCNSLEITISFDPKLMLNSGSLAECEWVDSHHRGKEYEITLDKYQSPFLLILSIMHEMVHVKQFAKGELVQSMKDGRKHKWQKNQWIDDTKMGYYDLPWEIEAHGREKGLLVEWINQTDLMSERQKQEWKNKFLF